MVSGQANARTGWIQLFAINKNKNKAAEQEREHLEEWLVSTLLSRINVSWSPLKIKKIFTYTRKPTLRVFT